MFRPVRERERCVERTIEQGTVGGLRRAKCSEWSEIPVT